jgi:hypothetical protein
MENQQQQQQNANTRLPSLSTAKKFKPVQPARRKQPSEKPKEEAKETQTNQRQKPHRQKKPTPQLQDVTGLFAGGIGTHGMSSTGRSSGDRVANTRQMSTTIVTRGSPADLQLQQKQETQADKHFSEIDIKPDMLPTKLMKNLASDSSIEFLDGEVYLLQLPPGFEAKSDDMGFIGNFIVDEKGEIELDLNGSEEIYQVEPQHSRPFAQDFVVFNHDQKTIQSMGSVARMLVAYPNSLSMEDA